MRTAPALQITVARFDRWRAGLCGLALAAPMSVAGWAWTSAVPSPQGAALTCLAALLAGWLLHAEWRREPHVLHWDGQVWHWGAARAGDEGRRTGRIEVALDLGRWMLLRLVPDRGSTPGRASRPAWLPVQAVGLERNWHALRCAVYSPTPAAAPLAAMNSPTHER